MASKAAADAKAAEEARTEAEKAAAEKAAADKASSDASEPSVPPPAIAPLSLKPAAPETGGEAEDKATPLETARGKGTERDSEQGSPRGLDRAKMANEVAAEMRCPLTGRLASPRD